MNASTTVSPEVTTEGEQVTARNHPPFGGSLAYLAMNFPLGIITFVSLVTLGAVGVGTSLIWVGLPILALVILTLRGAGRAERARIYALLNTFIEVPYRPLPAGKQSVRWRARLRDPATWRDLAYFLLLLPAGVLEFALIVSFWWTSVAIAGMPLWAHLWPENHLITFYDAHWFAADSPLGAIPWLLLGALCVIVSIPLTRSIAGMHARFAASLLRPVAR